MDKFEEICTKYGGKFEEGIDYEYCKTGNNLQTFLNITKEVHKNKDAIRKEGHSYVVAYAKIGNPNETMIYDIYYNGTTSITIDVYSNDILEISTLDMFIDGMLKEYGIAMPDEDIYEKLEDGILEKASKKLDENLKTDIPYCRYKTNINFLSATRVKKSIYALCSAFFTPRNMDEAIQVSQDMKNAIRKSKEILLSTLKENLNVENIFEMLVE